MVAPNESEQVEHVRINGADVARPCVDRVAGASLADDRGELSGDAGAPGLVFDRPAHRRAQIARVEGDVEDRSVGEPGRALDAR